ncbi:MAG TPA: hypothetical protein ENI82_04660 [Bacteroidetes bacterium]|nr:hypothetical protein [Bacteroidota bacterium]
MLQTQAVEAQLLELLKDLMKEDLFQSFYLVGGTSLSLQLGHRNSIDIDLFGSDYLDNIEILEILNRLGKVTTLKQSKVIKIYEVNGIKVDIVSYQYPWLEPAKVIEGIRLASKKDIAAMKLNAITGRGSKKDFIDLYFLLKEYTLKEIMAFYNEKFKDGSSFLVLKSLCYFEDADKQKMPKMYIDISWKEIKNIILEKYNSFFKNLNE